MEFEFENCETWDWQGSSNFFPDNFDVSECLWAGTNLEEDVSFLFDGQMTPIKECGEFSHFINNCEEIKGLDKCEEPSSIAKRSRMLQFKEAGLNTFGCEDMSSADVRSKESVLATRGRNLHLESYLEDSGSPLEESFSKLSNCVSECAEATLPASAYSSLDQSSAVPVAGLFNADTQTNPKEKVSSQIDIAETRNSPILCAASNPRCPVGTHRNGFKGRKSCMKTPANVAASVAYPFAFLKPCAVHGDVTLKDINQRIRTPPPSKLKRSDDDPAGYLTSAFSGKPVVGTTIICTEGGKGKIKILRTRG